MRETYFCMHPMIKPFNPGSFLSSLLDKWLVIMLFCIGAYISLDYHGSVNRLRLALVSDGEGYYLYLPAVFIYGNFHDIPNRHCCSWTEDTHLVNNRYTCGVAIMELPFFLAADAVARMKDRGDDFSFSNPFNREYGKPDSAKGYTDIHAWGIALAALFYVCFGLWFLQQVLKRYFPSYVAGLTITLIFLGTNLLYYVVGESGMSHSYSFFLFAGILFFLDKWLKEPNWKLTLIIGFFYGLAVLIRPTGVIFGLVFLLWDVYTLAQLKARFFLLIGRWKHFLGFAVIGFVLFIPQMMYWNLIHGKFLAWSYGGESFSNWMNPRFFSVMFHYQNGLFLYSPILLLVFPGLILSIRQKRFQYPAFILIFLLSAYIFGSWWCWWFGAALGHRSFVEYFTLFSLPMAACIQWLFGHRHHWFKAILIFIFGWMILANKEIMYIYWSGWDGPNWHFADYVEKITRSYQFWL